MQDRRYPVIRVSVVLFQVGDERQRVAMGEFQHRPVARPVVEPPAPVGDVGRQHVAGERRAHFVPGKSGELHAVLV